MIKDDFQKLLLNSPKHRGQSIFKTWRDRIVLIKADFEQGMESMS